MSCFSCGCSTVFSMCRGVLRDYSPTCNSSRSPSTARRGFARQTAAEDGASTMGFFQLGMRLKEAIVKVQMYSAEYDGGRVRAGQRWLQSEMDV